MGGTVGTSRGVANATNNGKTAQCLMKDREKMSYAEQLKNQAPINVACRCGWQGKSGQLTRHYLNSEDRHCPECHAIFAAWPAQTMNPKIKELCERLRQIAAEDFDPGQHRDNHPATRAASILQAVFDPENQPSQYGTTLLPK